MNRIVELNAADQSMGRIASKAAVLLRGKDSPDFAPHKLPEVEVHISNLDKVKFTGAKLDQKTYYHYSGYHGGLKARKLSILWATKPQEVMRQSIYRMLPKNKLRDKIIQNLKFTK
jgi:large subunit ribosomal protein L13